MNLPESALPAAPSVADAHDQQAWRAGFSAGLPTLFGIAAWG